MIYNATLLRVDDPEPSPDGPDISVRCAATPLSNAQQTLNLESGWGATLVLYIPLRRVPSPRPTTNGHALLRIDGDEAGEVLYAIKHVIQRNGRTLGHIQVYLAP